MADQFLYEASLISDSSVEPFVKKNVTYIQDQNNSSYTGQIRFSTTQLVNQGTYVDWSSGFITIPYTIVAKSSKDITATANAFMCSLKNGSYQLVNSIKIDFDGVTVVESVDYLNHLISYKLMTSFCQDDLAKHSGTTWFYPDTASSFRYSADGSAKDGSGLTNNRMVTTSGYIDLSTAGWKGEGSNSGLLSRAREAMDISTGGLASTVSFGGIETTTGGPFLSATQAVTNAKSYFTDDAGTGAARIYTWHLLARIRLKDLTPNGFFEKMPLTKVPMMNITINYNASSQTAYFNGTGVVLSASPTITGQTNPLLIASAASFNPNYSHLDTSGCSLAFGCGVVSATEPLASTSKTNNIMTSCRLYVEAYQMNPDFEMSYIKQMPTKTLRYTVLYQQLISSVSGTFSTLITNGLKNIKTVIVFPYLNKSSNGSNASLTAVPVYQSPFTTEPATTSPLASIQNFQVQVAGTNMFNNSQSYDFEQFLTEVNSQNAVNGGKSTGVCSGLIDLQKWTHAYRYYVCDVSRRLPLDDEVSKSILVSGSVNTSKTLDLLVFVEYEREIQIDMETGKITSSD